MDNLHLDLDCKILLNLAHPGRRPELVVLCNGMTVVTVPVVLVVMLLMASSLLLPPPPWLLWLCWHQLIKEKKI